MTRKIRNRYEVPEIIVQILEEGRRKRGITTGTAFYISRLTNELIPRSLPKNPRGSMVAVLKGGPPEGQDINLITEIEDTADNIPIKRWIPSYPFYLNQFVIFWEKGVTYTYQIRSTDKIDSGEFVLVKKEKTLQQPGVASRTNKTGGSKSQYSR